MQYFKRIATGFDVAPAVEELDQLGTTNIDAFPVRTDIVPLYQHPALLGIGCQNTHYAAAHALLKEVTAALGHVAVYSAVLRVLPPGGRLPQHQDGLTRASPVRYHLALQCDERSRFTIREEQARFAAGELWRVDLLNRPHSVVNDSDRARLMLMVDVFEGTEGGQAAPPAVLETLRQRLRLALGDDWERAAELAARFAP